MIRFFKIRNLLVSLLILLAAYGMLIVVSELPPYGKPNNPVHNLVSEKYINESLNDTGSLNMVTAIVLDYRAYDTMFETIVLFTATLAVVITLKYSILPVSLKKTKNVKDNKNDESCRDKLDYGSNADNKNNRDT